MAFDASNPTHLATLKSEVLVAMTAAESEVTRDVLAWLAADTGETVMNPLTKAALVGLVATFPDEVGKNPRIPGLLAAVTALDDERDLSAFLPQLEALVGADSPIVLAAKADTRQLTRAEALFGVGARITRADWIKARDS